MSSRIATSLTLLLLLTASVTATRTSSSNVVIQHPGLAEIPPAVAPSPGPSENQVDDGSGPSDLNAANSKTKTDANTASEDKTKSLPDWGKMRNPNCFKAAPINRYLTYSPGCWLRSVSLGKTVWNYETITDLARNLPPPPQDTAADGPTTLTRFRASICALIGHASATNGDLSSQLESLFRDSTVCLFALDKQAADWAEAVVRACTAALAVAFSADCHAVSIVETLVNRIYRILLFVRSNVTAESHAATDSDIMLVAGLVLLARRRRHDDDPCLNPTTCLSRLEAIEKSLAEASEEALRSFSTTARILFADVPSFKITAQSTLLVAANYLELNAGARDRHAYQAGLLPLAKQQLALVYGVLAGLRSSPYATDGHVATLLSAQVLERIPIYVLAALQLEQRDRTSACVAHVREWIGAYASWTRASMYVARILELLLRMLAEHDGGDGDLEARSVPKSDLGAGPGPLKPRSWTWAFLTWCSPCCFADPDIHAALPAQVAYRQLMETMARICPEIVLDTE